MWSRKEVILLEQKITARISGALHQIFRNNPTAVKGIAEETGGALTTVKKWYEGRNPPSLGHFLILCRHYESVLEAFLGLSGNDYLIAHVLPAKAKNRVSLLETNDTILDGTTPHVSEVYGAGICTINVAVPFEVARKLNQRQLWFLGLLQQGRRVQIDFIVKQWGTSIRTAKTDISGLKEGGLIRFDGSQKTGRFILM